jgi:enoyl-CoA hydratase
MAKHIADRLWGAPRIMSAWGRALGSARLYREPGSAVVSGASDGWTATRTALPLLRTGVAIAGLTGGLLVGDGGMPLMLRRGSQAVGQVPRRARKVVSAITASIPIGTSREGEVSIAPEPRGLEERVPISLHVGGGVAVITLRRPEKMNAINASMWSALAQMVRQVFRDERVRVLVIRGEGRYFSAGSDLKELGESDLSQVEEIFRLAEECASAIEESPLPTIACIRGYALGTGLLLALACDLRIADREATLGMPIARLGITLSESFVKRLVLLTGPSRMKDLVYTGRLIDAEEGARLGLVDRLVSQERSVLHETLIVARAIRQHSRASIRAAKRWGGSGSGRAPAAYSYVDPEEFPEGVTAFLERRAPRFYDS